VNLLLVGAGRMGLRHLEGLGGLQGELHVVDPRPEVENEVRRRTDGRPGQHVILHRALEQVPLEDAGVSAAILAETANGRLERLEFLARAKVEDVLAEKPLEQSRARLRRMLEITADASLRVRVNHYQRAMPFFRRLRDEGGPFRIVVAAGAYGLACNGVHDLDLACFLTGVPGRLLYADLEERQIESGRGPQFRDYGGRALIGFEDGSSLYLDCGAESSAPPLLAVVQPKRLSLHDGAEGVVHERDPNSAAPVYHYGVDYRRRVVSDLDPPAPGRTTADWLSSLEGGAESHLPTLAEAAAGHELLFDLLETTGETEFAIT
jgi:predicted dehydrogenase